MQFDSCYHIELRDYIYNIVRLIALLTFNIKSVFLSYKRRMLWCPVSKEDVIKTKF
jgi:hypothetical protein